MGVNAVTLCSFCSSFKFESCGLLGGTVAGVCHCTNSVHQRELANFFLRQADFAVIQRLRADHVQQLATELGQRGALTDCFVCHVTLVVLCCQSVNLGSFFGGGAGCFGLYRFHVDLSVLSHLCLHSWSCRDGLSGWSLCCTTNANCPVSGDRNNRNFHRRPSSDPVAIPALLVHFVDRIANRDVGTDAVHNIVEDLFGKPISPETNSRPQPTGRAIEFYVLHHTDLLAWVMVQQQRHAARACKLQINAALVVVQNFCAERAVNRLFAGYSDANRARLFVDNLRSAIHSARLHLFTIEAFFVFIAALCNFAQFAEAVANHHTRCGPAIFIFAVDFN